MKKNKSGTQTLIVYYNNSKGDYDEMEALALKRHGLPENNKLNIICMPYHRRKD